MGYGSIITHWCSGYPQYIINKPKIHAKGIYLGQWLSSEIKLRIHTALGTTIYLMECLQSQAWMNITGWNPKPNNRLQLDPINGRV